MKPSRVSFDRTNSSFAMRWWWTIDRLILAAVLALIAVGAVLIVGASPPVAIRLGYDKFHFINHQYVFLAMGLIVMFGMSLLTPQQVRRIGSLGFACSLLALCLVPLIGIENNGARRWINLMGMSVQPSEFLKPFFAIVSAWVLSERYKHVGFPGYRISMALYGIILLFLLLQPDLGMAVTYTGIWAVQLFLGGLPFIFLPLMIVLGVGGLWAAYAIFPHVTSRIDRFLDPSSGDNYQVSKSLEAFQNGGLLGQGPGEGQVKQYIPDSHTDFIFSVAGEEFGLIFCLIIVLLFAFVIVRGFVRVWREPDGFVMLAVAGLLTQFGIQAVVNMGVTVSLLPAKGMTLPFLSYGGSSMLSIAIGMGMILALTRRRYGKVQ